MSGWKKQSRFNGSLVFPTTLRRIVCYLIMCLRPKGRVIRLQIFTDQAQYGWTWLCRSIWAQTPVHVHLQVHMNKDNYTFEGFCVSLRVFPTRRVALNAMAPLAVFSLLLPRKEINRKCRIDVQRRIHSTFLWRIYTQIAYLTWLFWA